jgi:hypothetical protein
MKTFNESQKFDQWWFQAIIYGSILIGIGPLLYSCYKQILLGEVTGDNPMSNTGLILTTVLVGALMFGVWWLSLVMKLSTRIDRTGIYIRFFPFHLKEKYYPWDEITHYEVVQYNPIKDYGGWGVRYGRKGKAFNVKGNMGLLLTLYGNKSILIGTQKENELSNFLLELNQVD